MNLPFSLSVNDFKDLDAGLAVAFFRHLLWAEAARVGIGRNLIDVPQCINVGDGGVDAYIEDADPLFEDVIPKGESGYQIKSSGLGPTACAKELHKNNKLSEPIKPEIKKLLDRGGTYILVLFADIAKPLRTDREKAIKEEFEKLGHKNAKFRLYTANQLLGFAERFPSVVSMLKSDAQNYISHSEWSKRSNIVKPSEFSLIDDDHFKHCIPGLTWRSGLTDKAGLRVLSLAKSGAIGAASVV